MGLNHKTEAEIKDALQRISNGSKYYSFRPKDFQAKHLNGKWAVYFTYNETPGHELHVRRGGIRYFKSLTALTKCLAKLGLSELKVFL